MQRTFRLFILLCGLLLAAAGCQPIQPEAAAPAAAEAPAAAAATRSDFPNAGVELDLPAGWIYEYEPNWPSVALFSEEAPNEPQNAGGHWPYLMEEPIAVMVLFNQPAAGITMESLPKRAERFFASKGNSVGMINPLTRTVQIGEPTPIQVGDVPGYRMVLQGTDAVLRKPFNVHAWTLLDGEHVLYIQSSLLPQNEAAFVPQLEEIVNSLRIYEPRGDIPTPPTSAREIAPGDVMTGTTALSPPDAVVRDHWRFMGKAGVTYFITVKPLDPYLDPVVDVVDARGLSLVDGERDVEGNDAVESVVFQPTQDGEYYIAVRSFFLDTGPYEVTLTEP